MHLNTKQRRRHSAAFKTEVLAACAEPGASVAAVALAFKLNDNLVHQWRRGRGAPKAPGVGSIGVAEAAPRFIELTVPTAVPPTTASPARHPSPTSEMITLDFKRGGLCSVVTRGLAVIRIDALWLCAAPVDMRSGTERLLAHVVHALGIAHAHHGCLFANARATRIKMLVHDGFGVWCAARRLNAGRFVWPREIDTATPMALSQAQFDALVVGLPWQRLHEMSAITRL